MAKVSDITLYTACTWAFLCNGRKLVIEHYVSRVAAYIGRTSYQIACHMLVEYQIELASAKQLRIGAYLKAPLVFGRTQCSTYGSTTIHTSCRNIATDQSLFQRAPSSSACRTYRDLLCASSWGSCLRRTLAATSGACHPAHYWTHSVP